MPSNVLVLMSDQHTPAASGAYGSGVVRTPHLDRLAARGTVFDAAYCNSPICVPSRAALATGCYPHQTGNVDNASPYLGSEAASWGHQLRSAGVPTVTVGKLHYRHVDDDTGFDDQRVPLHVRGGTGDLFHALRDRQPPAPQLRAAVVDTACGESDYTIQDRTVGDVAADWITREAPRDKPWACHVSFVTPHYPFTAPEAFLSLYGPNHLPLPLRGRPGQWDEHPAIAYYRKACGLDDPLTEQETRRALQHYFALVSFMDAQVGRVMQALTHSGQAENTVVVYLSDHGELMGTDGMWFKGTMTENSVRIPVIIAGPSVPAQTRSATPVSLVDIHPTILDILDIPAAQDLPGRSLRRILAHPAPDRVVFSEYHSANSLRGAFLIRFGRWKYIYYVGYPERLFDLHTDPYESHDLADDPVFFEPLVTCRRRLHEICDPEKLDQSIRARQRQRIADYGGIDKILQRPLMTHSPIGSR